MKEIERQNISQKKDTQFSSTPQNKGIWRAFGVKYNFDLFINFFTFQLTEDFPHSETETLTKLFLPIQYLKKKNRKHFSCRIKTISF